jgi:RNA polymerase sigma factor for flagellar operon FliA
MIKDKTKKQEIRKLWIEFKSEKNEENKINLRNKLVNFYLPFLTKIAYNLIESISWKREINELINFGFDGLIDAIEKFDLERKIKFETYSARRIYGSMIDNIRKEDHIPRSVRLNIQKIEKSRQKLESEKKDKVFHKDILEDLNISEKEYYKNIKKYNAVEFESLDGNDDEDFKQEFSENIQDNKILEPSSNICKKEFFDKLICSNFTVVEKNIIYLYYYKNYTMKNISSILNLSESRISQKHKNLLKRMKNKIRRNKDFFERDVLSSIYGKNSF